ncbi:uncharacterized protein V1510DRAFT_245686 [Dipodascopsis tothii]|uniref:uncharacterized protein n=1 Tax=Dipodascopsis tothii TaxID=44089 RepID=UPI0034CF8A42
MRSSALSLPLWPPNHALCALDRAPQPPPMAVRQGRGRQCAVFRSAAEKGVLATFCWSRSAGDGGEFGSYGSLTSQACGGKWQNSHKMRKYPNGQGAADTAVTRQALMHKTTEHSRHVTYPARPYRVALWLPRSVAGRTPGGTRCGATCQRPRRRVTGGTRCAAAAAARGWLRSGAAPLAWPARSAGVLPRLPGSGSSGQTETINRRLAAEYTVQDITIGQSPTGNRTPAEVSYTKPAG